MSSSANRNFPYISDGTDGSFQILHAIYILEKCLENFVVRDANFEVVFWTGVWAVLVTEHRLSKYPQIRRLLLLLPRR